MHDNSTDGSDRPPTDPPEPRLEGEAMREGFSAADYLRLAEECLSLASLTKDPEKAARLLKTADDYLHRAAEWLAHQIKSH
jgi:hypothetical protein